MSSHHEFIAVAPRKIADLREPEANAPPVPLQETHADGFKEPESEVVPAETESKGSGEPPNDPPVAVAPAADDPYPSPLDGRPVFDLPKDENSRGFYTTGEGF
jgi:hypothetical protein